MRIDIEKYSNQTLEELQTNEHPFLRFIFYKSGSTVEFYYGFSKCSCDKFLKTRGLKMCKHISFITNNYLIKNLKDLYLIDNRADISLYNFTKGDIMNIKLNDIIEMQAKNNIIQNRCDCPICLEKIKVSKVNCTTCVAKYHVGCVLKIKRKICPVCRSDLDSRIY